MNCQKMKWCSVWGLISVAPALLGWIPLKETAMFNHSGTALMPDGQVLVWGGVDPNGNLDGHVHLYDPLKRSFTPLAPLDVSGYGFSIATLPDGKIFVAGGYGENNAPLNSFRTFDPATQSWSAAQTLSFDPSGATLLDDGRVLLGETQPLGSQTPAHAHMYDPVNGTWTIVPTPPTYSSLWYPKRMANGKIMFSTTSLNYALGLVIYDPAIQGWAPQPSNNTDSGDTTVLPDGRVLFTTTFQMRLYSPSTDTWSEQPYQLISQGLDGAVVVPDGSVMIAGRAYNGSSYNEVGLIYRPKTNTFSLTPNITTNDWFGNRMIAIPKTLEVLKVSWPYAEVYVPIDPEHCVDDVECASGFCSREGVCCDSKCTDACFSCDVPGSGGKCVPAPQGTDVLNDCTCQGDSMESGTMTCANKSICPSTCDGTGQCSFTDCTPYVCNGAVSMCATSCIDDDGCADGFKCNAEGKCLAPSESTPPPGCHLSKKTDGGVTSWFSLLALSALAFRRRRKKNPTNQLHR